MNPRRRLLIAAAAVAAVQIGFLASMIAGRAAILRNGQEVLLQARPADPRDLLRGDYVVLGTNISSIPVSLFDEARPLREEARARTVFVRLREGDGGIWRPVAARYGERPEPEPVEGEVDIRGSTSSTWFEGTTAINVQYGLERLYVPEGEGRAIETAGWREEGADFRMKVAVARDGAAQIKSFHDGETLLYAVPLY